MVSLPIRLLALAAVLTAGVCTTIMNWHFSYQLGTNVFDAYVWGTFSVALDVCKWTMQRPRSFHAFASVKSSLHE